MTEPDYGALFERKHPVAPGEAQHHALARMAVVPGTNRISMICSCGRVVSAAAKELYEDLKAQEDQRVQNAKR
jgi:hypothetical protein